MLDIISERPSFGKKIYSQTPHFPFIMMLCMLLCRGTNEVANIFHSSSMPLFPLLKNRSICILIHYSVSFIHIRALCLHTFFNSYKHNFQSIIKMKMDMFSFLCGLFVYVGLFDFFLI